MNNIIIKLHKKKSLQYINIYLRKNHSLNFKKNYYTVNTRNTIQKKEQQ